jgi:transcriptional regulator with XRE-family HTH domain
MVPITLKIIRQIRIEKNISQEQMATRLCFTQSYYAKVELGKAKISAELLFRILEVLEYNCVNFFKRVEKMKSNTL